MSRSSDNQDFSGGAPPPMNPYQQQGYAGSGYAPAMRPPPPFLRPGPPPPFANQAPPAAAGPFNPPPPAAGPYARPSSAGPFSQPPPPFAPAPPQFASRPPSSMLTNPPRPSSNQYSIQPNQFSPSPPQPSIPPPPPVQQVTPPPPPPSFYQKPGAVNVPPPPPQSQPPYGGGAGFPPPLQQQQQPGYQQPQVQPGFQPGYQQPQVQPGFQTGYQQPQVQPGYQPGYQQQPQFGQPQFGYQQQQGMLPQKFMEEFESLSLTSAQGSVDVRMESLPRPADDEKVVEPVWSNCHPRYFELTTSALPNSSSLAARWHLPLGAVIHPLAEAPPGEEVPVVDFGTMDIVRCRRCRTYINPYSIFTDNGRYWRCSICNLLNEVPKEYCCGLDETGKRLDAMQRPELSSGSVDFVAPMAYMVRPPMPPVYFFLIDVSVYSVRSGMLQVAVDTIKSCLDKLPGSPRTHIGFLTFDSALHFYNLKSSLTQPQMVVLAQLDEPFLPLPDDLIVNLSESRGVVDALLDSLPAIFANNDNVESAFGPALQAATTLMGELGGKLLVFQSTLPSLGVGRLKLRGEDARVYQTDKEHSLRAADDPFYKAMSADCSKYQIAINVYAFAERYTDIASLGVLAKYTGGQVCFYPGFHASVDGERLRYDLARDLTRETAWEAVMRIRCGKGVKYNGFQGHFMMRSSDLLALPAVDSDKAYSVQFSLEDTLLTNQMVYFQVALLYTSSAGERRIRVHTAAVPVVSELTAMYKAANVGAIMGVLSRLALEKSLSDKLENARQLVQVKMNNSLREFRNLHAVKHQLMGRIIYPESLKLLPLYVLALCKSLPLRGGFMDATADDRSAAGYEMMTMSLQRLMKLLYATLIRLDEYLLQGNKPQGEGLNSLQKLPLSQEVLDPRGAFLFSDGNRFVVWLGNVLQPEFIVSVLGPQVAQSSDLRKVVVEEQGNDLSKRFHGLLGKLRKQNPASFQHCLVVRQGESVRELQLLHSNLVEDRGANFPSYGEWMVQVHRQVQQKI